MTLMILLLEMVSSLSVKFKDTCTCDKIKALEMK